MFKNSSLKKIILLDFGVSKVFRDNSMTGIIAISTFYCPPEINEAGKSEVSDKSDIFSLGMFVFNLFINIIEYYMNLLLDNRLGKIIEGKDMYLSIN